MYSTYILFQYFEHGIGKFPKLANNKHVTSRTKPSRVMDECLYVTDQIYQFILA